MTIALTVTTSRANEIYAKIENPMAAIMELGKLFHQSKIMGVDTAGDGAVLALTCMCEGITPLEFARTYHIIKGKPSMRADMMAAKFQAAGGKIKWINLGDDGKEAKATFEFDGQSIEIAYMIQDAMKAKGKTAQGKEVIDIPDGNWMKDRGSMLRARLITKSVRILAPGIIAGVYIADEIEDLGEHNPDPSKPTAEARKKRQKELDEAANAVVTSNNNPTVTTVSVAKEDVIIEAVVESKQKTADVTAADESVPFGTEDAIANPDQLRVLAASGIGAGYTVQEINNAAISLFSVASVKALTAKQAAELAARFKLLSEAIALGLKYPSQLDKTKNMERPETLELLIKAVQVDQAWKCPDKRIQNLIDAIRTKIGET